MTQAASLTLPAGAVQKAFLPLTGAQVNNGSGKTAVQSLVAGFELQATSGSVPDCSATVLTGCASYPDQRAADIKYVGSTSDAPQLNSVGDDPLTSNNGYAYFSITTQKPWRSPASFQEFDVDIDTNGDGVTDVIVYNTRLSRPATSSSRRRSTPARVLRSTPSSSTTGSVTPTRRCSTATRWSCRCRSRHSGSPARSASTTRSRRSATPGCPDRADRVQRGSGQPSGALSTDPIRPGLTIAGSYGGDTSPLLFRDTPSAVLQVRRDRLAYGADKALGALLIHFHNAVGNKAQLVTLKSTPKVAFTFAPSVLKKGRTTTANIVVAASNGVPEPAGSSWSASPAPALTNGVGLGQPDERDGGPEVLDRRARARALQVRGALPG